MTISYQWLMQYLPEPVPVAELSKILTSIGLEVEAIEKAEFVPGSLEGLVIGEIINCHKHPNADKLSVTKVNVGNGLELNIVCGAPNVAQGQRVVVAPVGTTVHPTSGEPFLIKKAKIRGEESEGMICAEDEIGLGASHAGIMVLPHHAPIGTSAKKYFNIPDADDIIHIGLTPNRSDAMSHIGVARDVCAYLSHHKGGKYEVLLPPTLMPNKGKESLEIKVNVKAPEACPKYTGVSIKGVKIAPSPEWLQLKLKSIGVRSINNVVDITNYVLHEFGQPLHAFDADKIKGNVVNVEFKPQDTKFLALDGKEIKLNDNDLMICDNADGMCIAGVFGGLNSGVTDTTTNIFLESAYFHPKFVRRTSMYHGLRTDAATHFEKGVDINNVIPALKRAAALIVEIAGGEIASGIVDVTGREIIPDEVHVTYEYITRLSGKDYGKTAIKNILTALGFGIDKEDADGLILKVPSNKTDITNGADIVEEILRIDGLDNIAIPERLNISLAKAIPSDRADRNKMANLLTGIGFKEIVTNSIVNSKYYPERNDLVKMLNSLTSELDVMRPSMLESGLEVIAYNCNRKNTDLSLYEYGKVYSQAEGKYIEQNQLALYITGNVNSTNWNQQAVKTDIYYLKGIVQHLLAHSGITKAVLSYDEANITWKFKNEVICSASKVDGKKLKEFDIKQDVYFAAINWDAWQKAAASNKIKYSEVAKFPAVERDLAIILDKHVKYNDVAQITEQQKIESLKGFGLFDVFENEKLGAGKKSYALNYTFQLQDRTLTDSEVEQVMQQLMNAYKTKLQAQIRE
ncbi:MAG: phenylalanine--tRNA ligase subunit beta [Bacteroidetes bacterium]|nr:phenylalanine--tRNA ligase subunit beta [Bacteroidota bacterium]